MSDIYRSTLLSLVFFVIAFHEVMQTGEAAAAGLTTRWDTLKILTWNIVMLPRQIYWLDQVHRGELIARTLMTESYDVIVFQEAFDPRASRTIRKILSNDCILHRDAINRVFSFHGYNRKLL